VVVGIVTWPCHVVLAQCGGGGDVIVSGECETKGEEGLTLVYYSEQQR
jgi:hypothetical protein